MASLTSDAVAGAAVPASVAIVRTAAAPATQIFRNPLTQTQPPMSSPPGFRYRPGVLVA